MFPVLRRFIAALRGHPCDVCGGTPTKLVVDAVPAGKRLDGKTGMVTKTFAVRSCAWLCSECR